MLTTHGHFIPGTVPPETGTLDVSVNCGGVKICPACKDEATMGTTLKPYQERARQLVFEVAKQLLDKSDDISSFTLDKVFVVWFAKTLQNWKALISTELLDGMYYEVTYNGNLCETYIDAYRKIRNVRIPDA
jgi:hypothetical protein